MTTILSLTNKLRTRAQLATRLKFNINTFSRRLKASAFAYSVSSGSMLIILILFLGMYCCQDATVHSEYSSNTRSGEVFLRDSIMVNSINSSLRIEGFVDGEMVILYDRSIGWIRKYDPQKGTLIQEFGTVVNESNSNQNGISLVRPCNDGYIVRDNQWILYLLDSNGDITSSKKLDFFSCGNSNVALNPIPNNISIYEPFNYSMNMICEDQLLWLPVITEHVEYNQWMHPGWYDNSKMMSKVDLSNGHVFDIDITRKPINNNLSIYPNFIDFDFLIVDDKLLISHMSSHKLFIYSKSGEMESSFGIAGTSMNFNYRIPHSYDDAESFIIEDREIFGGYLDLEMSKVDNEEYLLRSYYPGSSERFGLQIYKNKELIADLQTPKYFSLIGCQSEICYGYIKNPSIEPDSLAIYSFNLVSNLY